MKFQTIEYSKEWCLSNILEDINLQTISLLNSFVIKHIYYLTKQINITKNIESAKNEEKENIFNKSLMLIYTLAVKDEKSAELTKDVLHIINSEYHTIAKSHFYIPQALVREKTPEVEKLMKDAIFKNTLERIKLQRELLEK